MEYDYHAIVGIIGIALGLLGYGLYLRTIFRGDTKPHLFTWLTYTLIDATIYTAQLLHGAGPGSWALLLSVIENSLLVCIAFRWGERHMSRIDWFSFAGALIGIGLWIWTNNALTAVVIACIVGLFGLIPTLRKAYARPDQESITLWGIDMIRFALSILSLATVNLTTALFPVDIICTNGILVGTILIRRRRLSRLPRT